MTNKKKHHSFKPPRCHSCNNLLYTVYENEGWTYFFNRKSGRYSRELVVVDILCPDCNAKLWDEFPEGTCNYRPKSKKK